MRAGDPRLEPDRRGLVRGDMPLLEDEADLDFRLEALALSKPPSPKPAAAMS